MKALSKLFDIIGKILAFVWMIAFILWVTNANWHYLDSVGIVVTILNIVHEWGALALVGVVGFEAVAKRKLITKILFLLLLAVCVIFMFFPGVTDQIFNIVK